MIFSLDYEMCIVDRDFLESSPRACRTLYHNPGNHRSGDSIQQGEEFLQLVQSGVGDVDDVFVFYRKALCEKIGIGVAEIETVDNRRASTRTDRQRSSFEGADNVRRLEAKKKYPRRICSQVLQPSGLRQRLG